jgi:hypothetical protein
MVQINPDVDEVIVYAPDSSTLQLAESLILEAVSPPAIKFAVGQDVPATVKEVLGFGAVVMVCACACGCARVC